MEKYDRYNMTQAMRWQVADWLSEDRLPGINAAQEEVRFRETFYTRYGKRMLDIVISLIAVTVTLPINLIIGVITFFDVGRPIFFFQERVGRDRKIFRIVKFRNMRNTVDERGELLPANKRVTKWGKIVRKTSMDELMNFFSILKGDMSVIGPRPLVPQYLSRYSKRHLGRYRVKPGLECPPRDYRTPLRSWNDQFENDIWYVEHLTFKTDVMQVINLFRFTFNRKNSAVRSAAARGDFMGYNEQGEAINLSMVPEEYIIRAYESEELKEDKQNA